MDETRREPTRAGSPAVRPRPASQRPPGRAARCRTDASPHVEALPSGSGARRSAPPAAPARRRTDPMADALTPDELRLIDAWWRAANYLTVGQIYLQDNPLLREPLRPEHIKPRLLGHWGTSPGLSLLYAHVNRLDPARRIPGHLPRRPGARRTGASSPHLPRRHLQRDLPAGDAGRGGDEAALPAVLHARRHPEPRERADARLDPRGRRAGLRAGPRLRRRVRQPGPGRHRGGRRRRGRDRSARGQLEGHHLPQPGARRRGAADPPPQRLQDLRPHRARPQRPTREVRALLEGHGYEVLVVEGDDPPRVHQALAAALDGLPRAHPPRSRPRRAHAGRDGRARAGR